MAHLTGIPHGRFHDAVERVVCLTEVVYYVRSAFAVAAHEAGHAIRDATNAREYLANPNACDVPRLVDTAAAAATGEPESMDRSSRLQPR